MNYVVPVRRKGTSRERKLRSGSPQKTPVELEQYRGTERAARQKRYERQLRYG